MEKTVWGLQDYYLNQLRKESVPTTFYLINGFQLKAVVRGFDNFIVLVESDGRQQMIYKHAISTITPSKQFNITVLSQNEREIMVDDGVLLVQDKNNSKTGSAGKGKEEKYLEKHLERHHKRKSIEEKVTSPLLLNQNNEQG